MPTSPGFSGQHGALFPSGDRPADLRERARRSYQRRRDPRQPDPRCALGPKAGDGRRRAGARLYALVAARSQPPGEGSFTSASVPENEIPILREASAGPLRCFSENAEDGALPVDRSIKSRARYLVVRKAPARCRTISRQGIDAANEHYRFIANREDRRKWPEHRHECPLLSPWRFARW